MGDKNCYSFRYTTTNDRSKRMANGTTSCCYCEKAMRSIYCSTRLKPYPCYAMNWYCHDKAMRSKPYHPKWLPYCLQVSYHLVR